MEPIVLKTKRELDIFVNPQRQNIIRFLRITGKPMTPKQISGRVGVSPSSVQHHIRQLLSIGVVEPDHTESVRGITARYYRLSPRPVSIGMDREDGLQEQRLAVLQSAAAHALSGLAEYSVRKSPGAKPEEPFGDMMYGVLRLEDSQAKELYALIRDFLQTHETGPATSRAWEYALIAYPVDEETHE